jgi:4,5-DOPA dioxygenase extradiol
MNHKQPVLFIGHGSPMNVISKNNWTEKITNFGQTMKRPDGIVMISAHWLTDGLKIHASAHPKTIHDFRGFPKALHDIQYPAPSQKALAEKVHSLLPEADITDDWGYDHGTWGVLYFLVPHADVPVIPVSINVNNTVQDFIELGRRLQSLRDQNILIIGSGNIVHNLREIDFADNGLAMPWAQQFDQDVKSLTAKGDLKGLMDLPKSEEVLFHRAHPTSDHWAPYLVCLGAADDISNVHWIYEGIQNGSISMRSAEWVY